MSTTTLRGSCRCGAVTYEVDDAFSAAFYCHCSRCRRATGSAFKATGSIPFERIRLTNGQGNLLIYGDPTDTHDVLCATCGSLLYSFIAENGNGHVTLGTLIDPPSVKPSFHMFVGSKAPWYEIRDDLPQFEELPA